jgi:spore germination cell wall hydrolase CwlJ-like protein
MFIKGIAVCVTAVLGISTTAHAYTDNDLYTLSHIISAEAGNCGYYMMVSVGSVVLNRVNDSRFPDTIEEVVFQPGQYQPTWNGTFWNDPTKGAVEVAKQLLEEGSQIDSSVVFQAEFPQGCGIYDTIESPFGTVMYFCY